MKIGIDAIAMDTPDFYVDLVKLGNSVGIQKIYLESSIRIY